MIRDSMESGNKQLKTISELDIGIMEIKHKSKVNNCIFSHGVGRTCQIDTIKKHQYKL